MKVIVKRLRKGNIAQPPSPKGLPVRHLSLVVLTALFLSQSVWAADSVITTQPLPEEGHNAPLHVKGSPAVKGINFQRNTDGSALLRVEFSGSAPSVDLQQNQKRLMLDLGPTPLGSNLSVPMNVANQGTVVQRIGRLDNANTTRIALDLSQESEVRAYQTGVNYVLEILPKTPVTSSAAVGVSPAPGMSPAPQAYTGKPVTLNFQDVPVRTVLQLISEEAGINVVAADTVSGNITLRLINVPWDQALDIVLMSKGLDKRRNGRVVWVAPQPELAKFEQDKEDARIALEHREDLQTAYIQINYHNAATIFKAITEAKGIGGQSGGDNKVGENSFLSPRGRLVADERTNTLMVSDIPKKIEAIRDMISVIDRPVDQVLIESRIVIANDSFARDLGARFGIAGRRQYGGNTAIIGDTIEGNHAGTYGTGVNLPAGGFVTNSAASLAYTLLGANFSLDVELSAMQEEQKGEVLSNPRIITANQREGIIRQGKEVGYVTVTGGTAGTAATPNVQFKEALLELKVTPTITNDGRVFLNLNVKKDEIESFIDLGDYGAVPQFNKREINTAVLLEDGQTVVIGGVYEFTDRESVAKVPFLGDVPFLGNLFKKKGRSKQKAELLIFITPKTMRVSGSASSPVANFTPTPAITPVGVAD